MGQLISMAQCWKEALWLYTVPSMLEDIPCQCPIGQELIMDVLIGHMLKGLQLLHLTLWLLIDVVSTDDGSLPHSVSLW